MIVLCMILFERILGHLDSKDRVQIFGYVSISTYLSIYLSIYLSLYLSLIIFIYIAFHPCIRIPKWLDPPQTQRFVRGIFFLMLEGLSGIMPPSFMGFILCIYIYMFVYIHTHIPIGHYVSAIL